jgi:hypothetical protein
MVKARQAVTPASASPVSAGPGAVQPIRRDRATARVASPPSNPTNASANTRPAGRAAPVTSVAAAIAATASAPATVTATRLPPGTTAALAQPAANRHRAVPPSTWASSAAMAAPHWRRSAGSTALAAASSHAGPSIPDSLEPACRHQARHSSQAASIAGVPNTAIQMAMSSQTLAGGGSALRAWRTHRQAKGVAAIATAASPPMRPRRRVRLMCRP